MKKTLWLPLLALVVLAGCMRPGEAPSGSVQGELKPSQRFTLPDTKGQAVSLDRTLAQHKSVLVNFWATWCSYCVEEMPDLIKLQDRVGKDGFTVLAVNVGETAEQASYFIRKQGLNFPVVLDTDSTVAQNYGLVGIPVSYLIDPGGKILGEYHGFTKRLVADVEKSLKAPHA